MGSETVVFRKIDPSFFESRDCLTRGCPNEAEAGETICRNCRVRPRPPVLSSYVKPSRRKGDRVYGDHRDLVDGTYGCKTVDCDGRSKTRVGPYAYLCSPCSTVAFERRRARRPRPGIS